MKIFLVAAALILTTLFASTAEARRGSCANGKCSVQTADLTPKKFDAAKHPRDPETGKFVPAPKAAVASEASDCGSMRQPVRNLLKAVHNRRHKPLIRLLTLGRRG